MKMDRGATTQKSGMQLRLIFLLVGVLSTPICQALDWTGLTADQQQVLQLMKKDWSKLKEWQQIKAQKRAQRYLEMTPEKRQRAKKRFEHWQTMTPAQREDMRRKFQRFHKLPPQQRKRLRELYNEIQGLPPEQQKELMQQWQRDRHNPHKLALQEANDGLAAADELGAVAPTAVRCVGQRHLLWVARVPTILSSTDLLGSGRFGEWR